MLQSINPFLVAGLLFFLSLVAGALSEKIKVPALILFLAIGMLAGVDGPGGINFSDANAANQVGTMSFTGMRTVRKWTLSFNVARKWLPLK